VDLFGAIIGGLLSTVAYVVIFFGVYKLYQIAIDIREIKDLVVSGRRVSPGTPPSIPIATPALTPMSSNIDLANEDSAAAYAEHLLRAVNAEQRTGNAPQEVR